MSIGKLPTELLDNIFSFMDPAPLAQCRLVCKHWNPLAERAMFKRITVRSSAAAKALCYHLTANKDMCRLIKTLLIPNNGDRNEYIKLIQLAFTPAMETLLLGGFDIPNLFKHIVDITKASKASFRNLQRLPYPALYDMHYFKAIPLFKTSLQYIDIHFSFISEVPWLILSRLKEFNNLTTLSIRGGIDSLEMLNKILSTCPASVQTLNLAPAIFFRPTAGKGELLDWMQTHVEKVSSLKKITVQAPQQSPDIIDYLLYKYPNITEAELYVDDFRYWALSGSTQPLNEEGCQRIIKALNTLPRYCIFYMANVNPL